MAKRISSAGGDAQWIENEKLTARFTGTHYATVDGEQRTILNFTKADNSTLQRWSSYAFDKPLADGTLKAGDVLDIVSYPKRGKGKKQFRPFDVSVLDDAECKAAGF